MHKPQEDYKQKTCPVCGKVFFCYTESWCYHRTPFGKSRKYLCSWKCLNEFDRIRLSQVKPRGRKAKGNRYPVSNQLPKPHQIRKENQSQ